MSNKYLDYDGLKHYSGKLKEYIDNKLALNGQEAKKYTRTYANEKQAEVFNILPYRHDKCQYEHGIFQRVYTKEWVQELKRYAQVPHLTTTITIPLPTIPQDFQKILIIGQISQTSSSASSIVMGEARIFYTYNQETNAIEHVMENIILQGTDITTGKPFYLIGTPANTDIDLSPTQYVYTFIVYEGNYTKNYKKYYQCESLKDTLVLSITAFLLGADPVSATPADTESLKSDYITGTDKYLEYNHCYTRSIHGKAYFDDDTTDLRISMTTHTRQAYDYLDDKDNDNVTDFNDKNKNGTFDPSPDNREEVEIVYSESRDYGGLIFEDITSTSDLLFDKTKALATILNHPLFKIFLGKFDTEGYLQHSIELKTTATSNYDYDCTTSTLSDDTGTDSDTTITFKLPLPKTTKEKFNALNLDSPVDIVVILPIPSTRFIANSYNLIVYDNNNFRG